MAQNSFSEKLKGELRTKKALTIRSMVCNLKQKVEREDQKDVVYTITCRTCEKTYIGETGKTFKERRERHKQDFQRGVESNAF
jgi:hypothetical protein